MSQAWPVALQDSIGTVRLRGPSAADAALRVRLRTQVAASELRPAGMPPSSILLIREVTDPRPETLGADGVLQCDPRWQSALDAELGVIYRGAIRPKLGRLPEGAHAVLFADPAELIASWLIALVEGRAGNWWWRLLAQRAPAGSDSGVGSLLRADPKLVPAVLATVASVGELAEVTAALSSSDVEELELRVGSAFGLASGLFGGSAISADTDSVTEPPSTSTGGHRLARPAEPPPWRRWLPGAARAVLSPRAERFVATALGLHLHPGEVRSTKFLAAVEKWLEQSGSLSWSNERQPRRAVARTSLRPVQGETAALGQGDARREPAPAESSGSLHEPTLPVSSPVEEPCILSDSPPLRRRGSETGSDAALGPRADQSDSDSSAEEHRVPERVHPISEASPSAGVEDLDGWPTHWGGVIYLIHIVREMKVLELFEEDWKIETEVGAWGALELLARGVLTLGDSRNLAAGAPSRADEWTADPIWSALATLDGRSFRVPPGQEFECSTQFSVPSEWSEAGGPLEFSGALCLAPLAAETEPVPEDLRRWVEGCVPWVAGRLLDLCGEHADLLELLACRGQLYVSATHVDLAAPLDQIRIDVRSAGLDRDPGWVSELGRIVSLVYE